jgi:regulator of replication initiation timing
MAEIYHIELSNFGSGNNSLFFVEDIQMCMCVIVPEIRNLHKEPVESVALSAFTKLKIKLDGLKYRLDQMASQQPNVDSFGDEEQLPYRYYYGYEDPNQDGWQRSAIVRAKTLIFDALSFYHILCMHLYSDVSRMRQLAKDMRNDNTALNEQHRKAQDSRRHFVSHWADTFKASAALHHASQILTLHQNLALDCEFEKRGLDAITFAGLRTAMLIVWAFCMFGHKPCFHCDSHPDANNKIYAEIDGLQVCLCNTDELVQKFRGFCPERWGLPEMEI